MRRQKTIALRNAFLDFPPPPATFYFTAIRVLPDRNLVIRKKQHNPAPDRSVLRRMSLTPTLRPLAFSILLLWGATAQGATLVVLKDGAILWATHAKTEGDTVCAVVSEEKTEKLPVANIAFLLPEAERGNSYPPQDIAANIKCAEQALVQFPKLAKQVVGILGAWKALQAGGEKLAKELEELLAKTATAADDINLYRDLSAKLQLLRYRDVEGRLWQRIDAALEKMRNSYLDANLPRLQLLATEKNTSPEHFRSLKKLSDDICSTQPADTVRAQALELIEKSRSATIESRLSKADSVYTASRSVDAYLEARAIIAELQEEVAATPDQKSILDKRLQKLVDEVAKAKPDYTFAYNGFPLDRKDAAALSKNKTFGSFTDFSMIRTREECLVFPLQAPAPLRLDKRFSFPARIICNRMQPPGRKYVVTALLPGERTAHEWIWECSSFTLVSGKADVTLSGDLSGLPADFAFKNVDQKKGQAVFLWLAVMDSGATPGDSQIGARWIGLSLGCRLPLQTK